LEPNFPITPSFGLTLTASGSSAAACPHDAAKIPPKTGPKTKQNWAPKGGVHQIINSEIRSIAVQVMEFWIGGAKL